jgi:hypothetical protein
MGRERDRGHNVVDDGDDEREEGEMVVAISKDKRKGADDRDRHRERERRRDERPTNRCATSGADVECMLACLGGDARSSA